MHDGWMCSEQSRGTLLAAHRLRENPDPLTLILYRASGGRAVARMWELLHVYFGLQRPWLPKPRGLHGGVAVEAEPLFIALVNGQM